ncbi:DsbC family protein [Panacagrimonas sp.]|uniref:DsbC family protein n=1 Tax=Panacagrimonas sp. TaxID=2480088 RepID=UPI003B52D7C4
MHKLWWLGAFALLTVACAPQQPDQDEAAAGSTPAVAPEPVLDADPEDMAALKARLQVNLPTVQIDEVRPTPIEGLYEIQAGFNFGYVSLDGRYLIDGDLNDLASGERLTENRRRSARATLVNGMAADQTIEYAPAKGEPKYTVTVFTDIDCGYCRKLHQHIKEYNDDGIAVRYVFFPRSGPETASFFKAEKVWCAADRKAALTEAKLGSGFEGPKECKNPVMDHLRLAAELGLRGTPAIVLPDGELIPGYQEPAQLLRVLAEHGTAPAPG